VADVQGVTVDEARVNSINKLAEKLITQGRTDTKFIRDKRDSLDDKYELFSVAIAVLTSKLCRFFTLVAHVKQLVWCVSVSVCLENNL